MAPAIGTNKVAKSGKLIVQVTEAKSKINQRVLELKAVGEFPALIKIARACKANIGLKGTELKAVVREVRHEHGIKYSHASGRYFWNH